MYKNTFKFQGEEFLLCSNPHLQTLELPGHRGRDFGNVAASVHYLLPDNGGGNTHRSDCPKPWGLKILPPAHSFGILEILGVLSSYLQAFCFSFRKSKRNKELTSRKYLQFSWKHMRTFLPPRTES